MSLTCRPAQWKKQNNNYVVSLNGYLLCEFADFDDKRQLQIQTRKTFILTPKNMDIFLDIDYTSKFDDAEEPQVAFYTQRDSSITFILRLQRVSQDQYVLEFAESDDKQGDDELEIQAEIILTKG